MECREYTLFLDKEIHITVTLLNWLLTFSGFPTPISNSKVIEKNQFIKLPIKLTVKIIKIEVKNLFSFKKVAL